MGFPARVEAQGSVRVAVLPVRAEVYVWGWHTETAVTGLLEEVVLSSGKAVLVDRQRLDAVLKEQAIARMGVTNPEGGTTIGNLLGADLLIMGTVVEAIVERGGTVWSPAGDLQVWRVALGLAVRIVRARDGAVVLSRLVRAEAQAVDLEVTVGGISVGLASREAGLLDRAARIAIDRLRSDVVRSLEVARSDS